MSNINEEIITASKTAINLFRADVRKIEKSTKEEIEQLLKDLESNDFSTKDKARMRLIECHIPLVMAMANRYHSNDYDELVAEGNLALCQCIPLYQPSRGKFSNFICAYIMTAMQRFLTANRAVRISYSGEYLRRKMVKFIVTFKTANGRMPTDEELMDKLNISKIQLKNAKERMGVSTESMNKIIDNGEDSIEIGDLMPSSEASIAEILEEREKAELLKETLKSLSETHQDILKSLYGIDKDDTETMEEIGKRYNKSKMWVCKQKQEAFGKLLAMQILQNA